MKKSHLAIPAVLAAAALSLSACAQAPDASSGSSSSSTATSATAKDNSNSGEFKACMVSDSAGFNDKSFNETSMQGLSKAASDLGVKTAKVESKDD